MLSNYSSSIEIHYSIKIPPIVNKLLPSLGNKRRSVLHYKNIQLYLSLGMKFTKVHRILKLKQSDWLKRYIDFNTNKIKNATNSFKKDFFKLVNNMFMVKQWKTKENNKCQIG